MPNKKWSEADDQRLASMWAAGDSASVIGEEFGVSRNSVIGRVHRLGLNEGVRRMRKRRTARRSRSWTPVAPDGPEPVSKKLSLEKLTPTTCRYPHGDPQDPDFHFCGHEKDRLQAYCDYHMAVAHGWVSVGAAADQAVANIKKKMEARR